MFGNFSLIRLPFDYVIKPFDCGDNDLNDFLLQDARNFTKELFAVTYIIENESKSVAFFSVLNDKISAEEFVSNRKYKSTLRDQFPKNKQFRSYPAVKIGRLGVDLEFQNIGLGTEILDYIKMLFVNNNRTVAGLLRLMHTSNLFIFTNRIISNFWIKRILMKRHGSCILTFQSFRTIALSFAVVN